VLIPAQAKLTPVLAVDP